MAQALLHGQQDCTLRLAGRLLADVRGLIGCLPGRMRCSRGSLLSLALRLIEGVLQRGGRLLEDDLPLSECLIDRFLQYILMELTQACVSRLRGAIPMSSSFVPCAVGPCSP